MSRLTFKDKARCHVRPPGYATLVEFVLAVQAGNTPDAEVMTTLADAFTAIVRGKTVKDKESLPLTAAGIAKALQLSKRGRKPATLQTIRKPVAVAAEVLRDIKRNTDKRGSVAKALEATAVRRYPTLEQSSERVRKQFEKYRTVAESLLDLEQAVQVKKTRLAKRKTKAR